MWLPREILADIAIYAMRAGEYYNVILTNRAWHTLAVKYGADIIHDGLDWPNIVVTSEYHGVGPFKNNTQHLNSFDITFEREFGPVRFKKVYWCVGTDGRKPRDRVILHIAGGWIAFNYHICKFRNNTTWPDNKFVKFCVRIVESVMYPDYHGSWDFLREKRKHPHNKTREYMWNYLRCKSSKSTVPGSSCDGFADLFFPSNMFCAIACAIGYIG